MLLPLPDPARRRWRAVRRAVLRRRRLLAALLAGVAVLLGVSAVAAPPPATVPVPVAARDLPAGAELGPDDVVTARFAPGTAPDGLARRPAGRVLAAPVARGEPVTEVRLVGAAMTAGRPELVALPVRLPDAASVDLLEVGDAVDLWAVDPQGGGTEQVAADVTVLAIPAPTPDDAGTGVPGRLVVLGVHDSEVTRVGESAVRRYVTYTWSPH
jgi:Flp pilus assembly protein CpaB